MSNQELIYDKDELESTVEVGEGIIKAIKNSIQQLEKPEDFTHEEVSESWVFISSLKASCEHNHKLIGFGAIHGIVSRTPGFKQRNKDKVPPVGINPVFVDSRPDSEKPSKNDLADMFIDFLENTMKKHKCKEEE